MSVQAFDIIFAGNLPNLFIDGSPSTNITCLEICGDFLYLGCKEGNLLRCSFKKSSILPEQTVIINKATHCYSTTSPIVQMKAISALTQLLVLSNETLTVLDLETLALVRTLKFKSITSFHLNENPLNEDPFTVEICAGSKKKILYIHLSDEHVKIIKEVSTSLTPSTLVMDGAHICFAMGFEYCMLDILSGEIQQLFAVDNPQQPLIIHRVSKGEFLLSGPGGLGVFVLSQGFSDKPPINFSSQVSALAFHHPYIIAVCRQGICFYSIIDQQCKQTIAIDNVRSIVNGDGRIFASTLIDLFALLPISWETQLEKLLADNRIEEALVLAANAHISSNDREQHKLMIKDLEEKVALLRFSSGRFLDAMELFETCNIDPRKVIDLDLEQMFPEEEMRNSSVVVFLDFLQRWRLKCLTPDQRMAVDLALLKYLARNDDEGVQLMDFIVDCQADSSETFDCLKTFQMFHCLATYYISKQKWEEAFCIWDRLMKSDIEDVHFLGYPHVAEQLTKCGDISLIWRFSGEILKRDEEMGAKIFTSEKIPAVKPRAVIDYLRNYPKSLRIFLEFLIEKKIDEESVHTQLAMMYIDDIKRSDLNRNSPGHRMTINKLRSLLRTSQKLELVKLLEILDTPGFPHEHAIVCGRLGQHSTAINTFINYLKDFDAAEEYCACLDDPKAWNALLAACVTEANVHMFDRVADLLRRRPHQFDVPTALLCLPDSTKFNVIAPFVNFAVREALHEKRMKTIEKALHQMDNLTNKYELKILETESFSIQPSSYCCVCKKRFVVTDGFVRYPNGVLTHSKCATSRHVCPLTGHLFQFGFQYNS
ncbi:transforming growth factor-beta receptor-associated protein 1-like [Daphnia pulicaria]|uniref:transforming growth factor-beta receptor-associated protein 1-like n=1 Tax=Daphnia pulicaria TaxID=35523 RepID=UPI001EEC4ABA|nr:transforming growth factor-beta receptor-associated protein 1-like [Daphnia pulicaria]